MIKTNKIDTRFETLRKKGKKAFIPFITAGDPDIESTFLIVEELIKNGSDLIELGVPYSDPSADGPVIMRADDRALRAGTRLKDIFELSRKITDAYPDIPVVLLLYFNSVFVYGIEKFFSACAKSGISGLIIPDLPLEERDEAQPFADQYNIYLISMVAPSSHQRINSIVPKAKGFLYCVASLGVTGERESFQTQFNEYIQSLSALSDVPKCLGFGISTPEQKRELEQYCDGTIVGSALVRRIEDCMKKNMTPSQTAKEIGAMARAFTEE